MEVTDQSFAHEVKQASGPVLVDFWAPWCGPCRSLAPILEELAKEYEGKVKFTKVNIDEHPAAAASLGITSIPALVLFKGGQVLRQEVGSRPKAEIAAMINSAI